MADTPPARLVPQEDHTVAQVPEGEDNTCLVGDPVSLAGESRPSAESGAEGVVRSFGDYELLREVARGGMGVVYRARQVSLNRIVALKMILSGQFASSEDVSRFHIEAEAAANLDHPGIVPIYEIGQHEGQHFFTMGFVEGESLADRLHQGPMPPEQAVELTVRLAKAMAYAHHKGVVHRDLKPANILLDPAGDPKVTDFGLAMRIQEESGLTRTGAVMGTPSYMSPEQAAGRTSEVGPRSDLYSLGALLYCLLTGHPPFQAASMIDTLAQVIDCEPVPICVLNPQVDRDLDAICLKCLEKSPDDRYQSAEELAAELECFLRGDEISVRSRNSLERLRRTLMHHRDDRDLVTWGDLLLAFAPIVLLPEMVIWRMGVSADTLSHPLLWVGVIRGIQLAAMLAIAYVMRRRLLAGSYSSARLMWSHWGAFLLGCHLVLGIKWISQGVEPGSSAQLPGSYPYSLLYPYFAVLSGVLWFALGSNMWGVCYLFGGLFFVLSLLIAWLPTAGPLLFGALWCGTLVVTGLRLKRMARDSLGTGADSRNLSQPRATKTR